MGVLRNPSFTGEETEAQRGQVACPKGVQLFNGTAGIQAHSRPESMRLAAMINSSSEVNCAVGRITYF